MVSLRSGSCIGADQPSEQSGEVQSCGPKPKRRAAPGSAIKTELPKNGMDKPKRQLRKNASRIGAKLDFLHSKCTLLRVIMTQCIWPPKFQA